MLDQTTQRSQQISALMDGQLPDEEFAQVLADLERCEQARDDWDIYHMVGDVMRSNQTPVQKHDPDFLLKLRHRMVQNAIEIVAIDVASISTKAQKHQNIQAANEPRWRRVAGVASVAMAAVLVWQGLHGDNSADPAAAPQFAQQQSAPMLQVSSQMAQANVLRSRPEQVLIRSDGSSALVPNTEPQVMIRDPQLDALLAAHRQFGGTTTLQMPVGFLQQAAFTERLR
nr:RseA family anti-sigma factor [uncultured Rhodoferax sp.]